MTRSAKPSAQSAAKPAAKGSFAAAGYAALDGALRAICLALPDTRVTLTWGKPHYRVVDKIFAGANDEGGRLTIGFKLEKPHARELIARDPRCRPAPYVGAHGWVEMEVGAAPDWDTLRGYLLESYRLIAPKASLAKLGLEPPPSRAGRRAQPQSSRRKSP